MSMLGKNDVHVLRELDQLLKDKELSPTEHAS